MQVLEQGCRCSARGGVCEKRCLALIDDKHIHIVKRQRIGIRREG